MIPNDCKLLIFPYTVLVIVKVVKERLTKQCLIKPSILLALLTTNAVCEWKFKSLSIITPKLLLLSIDIIVGVLCYL